VKVSDDAPVCESFAREGWCEKVEGTCPEFHVWECGEWRAKGTCSRGGRCGLRHVIRAEKGKGSRKEAEAEGMDEDQEMEERGVPVEGGFEDGTEFIEFGQGLPGAVSSEETEDESGESESEGSQGSGGDEDEVVLTANGLGDIEEGHPDHGKQSISPTPLRRVTGSLIPDIPMDTDEADEDEVLGVVT